MCREFIIKRVSVKAGSTGSTRSAGHNQDDFITYPIWPRKYRINHNSDPNYTHSKKKLLACSTWNLKKWGGTFLASVVHFGYFNEPHDPPNSPWSFQNLQMKRFLSECRCETKKRHINKYTSIYMDLAFIDTLIKRNNYSIFMLIQ